MKALCFIKKNKVQLKEVTEPRVLRPRDAVVRVTSTAICGSDLHILNGYIPMMQPGDILGHEFVGRVVEAGSEVSNLKLGDRVVVPFTIACGACGFCSRQLWSLCDNTNPNAALLEKLYGYSGSGLFGYSHLYGGYAGGQAEYVRVPFADVGPMVLPNEVSDAAAVTLADVFPTGYMAAENCDIRPGDVVAVWGCGPVGQFAIRSAFLLGAGRVIAIDRIEDRLLMAHAAGAETLNCDEVNVLKALKELTAGFGPDACIDCVGMEAHGTAAGTVHDWVMQGMRLATDRPNVLRQCIMACRKGGTVSIPGVYGGLLDKIPMGAAFAKGLQLRMGQTHVHKYLRPLLDLIVSKRIDPSFIFTHEIELDDIESAYYLFKSRQEGCIKVLVKPNAPLPTAPQPIGIESNVLSSRGTSV